MPGRSNRIQNPDTFFDVDLDAGITPEEQPIVAQVRLSAAPRILAAFFLVAMVILVASLLFASYQARKELEHRTLRSFAYIAQESRNATPGVLLLLGSEWGAQVQIVRHNVFPERVRKRLEREQIRAGRELFHRVGAVLDEREMIDISEAVLLALLLRGLISDEVLPLTEAERAASVARIDRVIQDGTAAILALGSAGAGVEDLRSGAQIASALSNLAGGGQSVEFGRAAAILRDRMESIESAAAFGVDDSFGRDRRERFAASALSSLRSAGSAIERLGVDGEGGRVLVAEGNRSVADLSLPFDAFLALRERLSGLGFVSVRVVGNDGTRVIPIAGLSSRSFVPSSSFAPIVP